VTGRPPRALAALGFGLVILAAWQIVGSHVDPLLLSRPSAVISSGWAMLRSGELPRAFLQSMQAFLPGYLLGALTGVPLGLAVGRYRWVESTLGIYVTAAYAAPLVALLPLYVVWFGVGVAAKVAIISTLTAFPIVINTWRGVKAVDTSLVEVGSAFGASRGQITRKVVLPAALPHIMTGLRLGVGRALIAMVIAEFFTAVSGLGGIIITAGNDYETSRMFVPIIVIMLLGVALTMLLESLERRIAPWHER
jgi:taurine transport system permease protein